MGFFTVEYKLISVHVGGDGLVLLSNGQGQLLRVLATDGEGGVVSVAADTLTLFTLDVGGSSISSRMVVQTFRKVILEDDIK